MHAYWRAANYLSVGQIYLQDNALLELPLKLEHVKPRLLGHWGTTTGLNFLYVHLNRLIKDNDLNMIYVIGRHSRMARLAIDMFCYSVRKQIAAMMAALGGVDLIVFTGGIGEKDGEVRVSICAGPSWVGVA